MNIDQKYIENGTEMYDMMVKLYPICRSITGNGVRKTLDIISEQIPLEKHRNSFEKLTAEFVKKIQNY